VGDESRSSHTLTTYGDGGYDVSSPTKIEVLSAPLIEDGHWRLFDGPAEAGLYVLSFIASFSHAFSSRSICFGSSSLWG
jgi:hypothetical protein